MRGKQLNEGNTDVEFVIVIFSRSSLVLKPSLTCLWKLHVQDQFIFLQVFVRGKTINDAR